MIPPCSHKLDQGQRRGDSGNNNCLGKLLPWVQAGWKLEVYTKELIAFALGPMYYGNPRFQGHLSSFFGLG